jgi:hypothetical protein
MYWLVVMYVDDDIADPSVPLTRAPFRRSSALHHFSPYPCRLMRPISYSLTPCMMRLNRLPIAFCLISFSHSRIAQYAAGTPGDDVRRPDLYVRFTDDTGNNSTRSHPVR